MTDMPNDEFDDLVAAVDADADELEIDLSEAKDFAPINGKRQVEVVGTKRGVAKDSGHPYIEAKFKVVEDEDRNRIVFKTLMLKGAGAGITKTFLNALGAGIDWDAPKISPAALVGLRGTAVLAADTREGYEHKTVVKNMLPAADAEPDPDADEVK